MARRCWLLFPVAPGPWQWWSSSLWWVSALKKRKPVENISSWRCGLIWIANPQKHSRHVTFSTLQGLRPLVARKLRFQPLFFHLDESELFGGSEIMDSVRQSFQRAGNELHVLRFEEVSWQLGRRFLSCRSCKPHVSPQLLPNAPALTALLKQRAEQTARVALHDIFRRRALLAATRQLGCSRLLLGDSSSRVASRALEEVLQGRGASVGAATVSWIE